MADLKPTGRNLLRYSDFSHSDTMSYYGTRENAYTLSIDDDGYEGGKCLKAVANRIGFIGSDITMDMPKDCLPHTTYVFSGYVRSAAPTKLTVRFGHGASENKVDIDEEWKYIKVLVVSGSDGYTQLLPYINAKTTIYFSKLKLEIGTEATPWTPAPEDSQSGGGTNMILAFDVITLATVTDVQGIYRFYQLATSKPSKPTTYPPASVWSDEMPGYQLGNQDSLYFVDVTVFNDLTYQYGEVQLSTDYEAVKATYADALQQIANAEKQMQSEIQKTSESIRTEVSEDYYKKDQTDDLLGTISTALEQTKDSFTMQFNSFQADLENVNADNSAKFQELYQYIRFKNGSIELGETGNTITLTIENDRISFKQAGQEIAYMSNNQLYITDANIVTSLRIGNFIFSPRPNGSLDFKKVGA